MSLFGLGRKGSLIRRPTLCFAVCYALRFLCCICVHFQEVSAGFTKDNDVTYRCCLHANAMRVAEHNGYLCLCAVALSWVLRFDSFFCRFLLDSIEYARLLSCHDRRPEILSLSDCPSSSWHLLVDAIVCTCCWKCTAGVCSCLMIRKRCVMLHSSAIMTRTLYFKRRGLGSLL